MTGFKKTLFVPEKEKNREKTGRKGNGYHLDIISYLIPKIRSETCSIGSLFNLSTSSEMAGIEKTLFVPEKGKKRNGYNSIPKIWSETCSVGSLCNFGVSTEMAGIKNHYSCRKRERNGKNTWQNWEWVPFGYNFKLDT